MNKSKLSMIFEHSNHHEDKNGGIGSLKPADVSQLLLSMLVNGALEVEGIRLVGVKRSLPNRDEAGLYPGVVVRTPHQLFLQSGFRQFLLHRTVHAVAVAGAVDVFVGLLPRPTPRTSSSCPPP